MTWLFLFFANVTLLLRLRLLLGDAPVGPRAWAAKSGVEIAALVLLLEPAWSWAAAILASVVAAAAAVICERRVRERHGVHLLIGLGQLLALSFCFGPALAPEVRPAIVRAGEVLRESSALGEAMLRLLGTNGLRALLGLLLVANEANLFIRFVLGRLQLRPGMSGAIDASEYARGRVIGLLERMLIYFFVFHGHYGAVGFTIAAKAFTRFKELDNRGFAEYVLIGTLLSSGLAVVIAVATHALR